MERERWSMVMEVFMRVLFIMTCMMVLEIYSSLTKIDMKVISSREGKKEKGPTFSAKVQYLREVGSTT